MTKKQKFLKFLIDEKLIKHKDNPIAIDEDILHIADKLGCEFPLYVLLSQRGDNSGSWWIQAEYYSKKLKVTIIIDYDVRCSRVEDVIDEIIRLEKEAKKLEKGIII